MAECTRRGVQNTTVQRIGDSSYPNCDWLQESARATTLLFSPTAQARSHLAPKAVSSSPHLDQSNCGLMSLMELQMRKTCIPMRRVARSRLVLFEALARFKDLQRKDEARQNRHEEIYTNARVSHVLRCLPPSISATLLNIFSLITS